MKIVIMLVFAIVMLIFMAYPAIKIAELIGHKLNLSQKNKNFLTIFLDILLSLIVGGFLEYF